MSRYEKTFFQGVAPEVLVKKDFLSLIEKSRLDTDEETAKLILLQSIEGHAHNGDGAFHKLRFVNTTTHDVVKALHFKPLEIKTKRQELIQKIFEFIKEHCHNPKESAVLVDAQGKPFLGIPWLANTRVNIADLFKGIYLGGLRDDPFVRKAVEQKYNIKIGGGKCYFVNTEVMEKMGLDGELLAHGEYEDKLDEFRQKGLISDSIKHPDLEERSYRYMYIRHRRGPGTSDDAAIISAGLLFNLDVALGVFLADAVDTLEKYVLEYDEWDEKLSLYIKDHFPGFDVPEEDLHCLTYVCSAPESGGKFKSIPDSSLRFLILINPATGLSTLQNHIAFITGKPFFRSIISHGTYDAKEFYSYIKNKISELKISPITPDSILNNLKKKVGELVVPLDKYPACTIVSPDDSVKEAIDKMQKEKSKILVVMSNDKVLGILEEEDLLHLFV